MKALLPLAVTFVVLAITLAFSIGGERVSRGEE